MPEKTAHHIAARTWLLLANWADVNAIGWRFVIRSKDDPDAHRQPFGVTSQHSIGVWLTVAEACHAYRVGDVEFTPLNNTDNEGGN